MDLESTLGTITDLQRASTVDGPGLRTTVFLKGCPLRCLWCHNPETQKHACQLAFDTEKAQAADYALVGLPESASSAQVLKRAASQKMADLVAHSASGAFYQYGRNVSVSEVMDTVIRDCDYYACTGGGLTVSGGEPMAQPEFALALLGAAKARDIHTVLDTTGVMSAKYLQRTLAVTDLYLFDCKATDDVSHRKLTGVSLQTVLNSLATLDDVGAQIILRCPIIPGLNDDEIHLKNVAALSRKYRSIQKVELLTWHTMGQGKYARLGMATDPRLPKENVSAERKAYYLEVLKRSGGIDVSVY